MDLPNSPQKQFAPWLTPLRFAAMMVGFLAAAFPKVLLGWEAFYYRDYGVLGYPFVYYHHAAFWRGELPLWNPLSNCGAPFLAQWGTMTLYPFSLVYLLLPLPWSLTWFCFGHLVLGALGVYYLVFHWTGSRLGAGLAGTAFVFNGIMFSCLLWPNYTVALGWMPWVILATERAWTSGGRRIVIAAAVAALQLLSGVPELVLLTWILVLALSARAFVAKQSRERVVVAKRIAWVIVLAAGLTAVQLLPFFDLLQHSHRDRSFAVSKWAMPSYGWGNFLAPLFHCFQTAEGPFFQYGQEFLTSYYPGLAAVALMIWALWKSRDARMRILAVLSIICVLLAFGENGFLFPLVKKAFPFVSIARYPIKFIIVIGLTLPIMAAFAIKELERRSFESKRSSKSLLFVCAGVMMTLGAILLLARNSPFPADQWDATLKNTVFRAVFLALFTATMLFLMRTEQRVVRVALSAGLLVIVFIDIRTHTAQQNPSLPIAYFTPGLWEHQEKTGPPRHGGSRAFITADAEKLLLRNSVQRASDQFLGKRMTLWSNLNLLEGIPKVNGSSTLQIREQMLVQKRLYEVANGVPNALLDFLGVSHSTSAKNILEWSTRSNYCGFVTGGQQPQIAADEIALEEMISPEFDSRTTVFLAPEQQPTIVKARDNVSGPGTAASLPGNVAITEVKASPHRIDFRVATTESNLCVIPQSYYHCWKAFIDGKPTRLLRANVAFQAVMVPPGTHQVFIVYRDEMFWFGLGITMATLMLCAVLWRARTPLFTTKC